MSTSHRTEYVIADEVIAGIAARAAAAVPGVTRLEPGTLGVIGQLARSGRQRWSGSESVAAPGIRVRRAGQWLTVQVDLSIGVGGHVGEVGRAVQRAVTRVVAEQAGTEVDAVVVTVVDIEPGPV